MADLTDIDASEFGPALLSCKPREQRFVIEFLAQGCKDGTAAARKAGYPDKGGACKVRAHELRHRPRVIAAMQELSRTKFGGLLPVAVLAAETILEDPKHPDHSKMVVNVLAAHGLGAQQRIDVTQTVRDESGEAIFARIERLAQKHGLDAQRLLSGPQKPAIGNPIAVVDAEFSEVKADG